MSDAAAVWGSLTDVERTALQVALYRCDGERAIPLPGGQAAYDGSIDRQLVAACMPHTAQEEYRRQQNQEFEMSRRVCFRTAAIDVEITRRVSTEGIRQVVILGAGLDTRAWRLPWPDATTVIEVDTGALESFKTTHLAAIRPLPPTCRRAFLRADVAHPQELQEGLAASGLDAGKPAVWVLEGLVGYLEAGDCLELFRTMLAACAPGSAAIITAPPTQKHQQAAAGLGCHLRHKTFEAAEATLDRLKAAGWEAAFLDLETTGPSNEVTWRQAVGEGELQALIVGLKPPL